MINKQKRDNTLIKRKNLVLEMKKQGIKRISPDSLLLLEKYFKENIQKLIKIIKEEMTMQGTRTLNKKIIKKIFVISKNKEEFWEL